MNTLLIDVGSTNIKYKMVDNDMVDGKPFPQPAVDNYPFYEVDPLKIYNTIKEILDETNPDNVYFSVQMHGYVLLKGNKEVTNYISWKDRRADIKNADFTIDSSYGVNLKPNLPRLSIKTQDVEFDTFCTLGSYLVYKLTGINASHVTDICPTGMYNIKLKKYDDFNFNLPKVYHQPSCIGKYKNTKIFTPIGDHQLSILGGTYNSKFDGYILNLGTAGQVCMVTDEFYKGDFESRPYFNNKFLLTVTNIPGGGYIKPKEVNKELEDELVNIYTLSINKLPKRDKLLVIGGLLNSRLELIERVLNRIGINYSTYNEFDALYGLELIAKGEIK